ncbi:hypothetical protein PQR71_12840 [Paraburkholderia fungorum]|uniref:hypothetical protein n=1 Tax=Paraburkholderia fungorum TaxID=134537 RepID=UPI0038B7317B
MAFKPTDAKITMQTPHPCRGRRPIDARSGRYAARVVNGNRQWVRDQVALQDEIVDLLKREGALPKKRIIMAMATAQATIETALSDLLKTGRVERYRAMSVRRRMDEHWCIAGNAPVASSAAGGTQYNAVAILTAMQQHAAIIHAGSANR